MHFVYIIYSRSKDRFYTGESEDPDRRLAQHNRRNVPSTAGGVPWVRVCLISKPDRREALALERKIKNASSRKRIIQFVLKHGDAQLLDSLMHESTEDGLPR